MSVSDAVRHAAQTVVCEEYPEVRFSSRMTDIEAAVGRVQLRRPPEQLAKLLSLGISTRRGIMNAHQEVACADAPMRSLSHSEAARDAVALLPLFDAMTADDQTRAVEALRG